MLSYIFYILYVNQHLIGEIMAVTLDNIIDKFAVLLIGVVLAPIIYDQATNANVSGVLSVVLSLVPTFFAIYLIKSMK